MKDAHDWQKLGPHFFNNYTPERMARGSEDLMMRRRYG